MDEGTCIVDALDGDIANKEEGIIDGITGLLKTRDQRIESKEDKIVSEDLLSITPVMQTVMKTSDYDVSVAEPEISEEDAVNLTKRYVIGKNTKTVTYEKKRREGFNIGTIKIVPRLNEVTIRGQKLIYVPKWDLQYEIGQRSFERRYIASSGRSIEDDLAKCEKCSIMRKPSVAVCEICGKPLCEKHALNEGGKWLCEDHISDTAKKQLKPTGILSKLKPRQNSS
jgi:hypothetical protein